MKAINVKKENSKKVKSAIIALAVLEVVFGVLADKYNYPTIGTILEILSPLNLLLFKAFNFETDE